MKLPSTKELTPDFMDKLFPENRVLMGFRGSVAHNMYVPNTDPNSIDDIDLMGVFMAPPDHYLGLKHTPETVERFIGKWDCVSYEYRKFVWLLTKSNPNVMAMLWMGPEFYLRRHRYGEWLLDHRDWFVSKKAYKPFAGYAAGQLKRMENAACQGYMGEKRRELVRRFGYDCKNAAHCLRLLTMAVEFLTEGKLNVYREDADEFLSVKRGEWALACVKEAAEDLFEEARQALEKSPLPEKPEFNKINELVMDTLADYTHRRLLYDD